MTSFGEATEWTDKPTVKVAVTDDAPALWSNWSWNALWTPEVFNLLIDNSGDFMVRISGSQRCS